MTHILQFTLKNSLFLLLLCLFML